MEISTPVKVLEGNSPVLGVTTGVVPGAGECAIITSSSAINVYSMTAKNITATWTFPTNQRECVVCPAYITNDEGGLASCQGGKTFLQWKSNSPSTKSFVKSELNDDVLVLVPMNQYLLSISKSFVCTIYSFQLEEIQKQSIPLPDQVMKTDIKKQNSRSCTVTILLRYDQQYKVFLVQCSNTSAPQLKIISADIPVESAIYPVDCSYSPSNSSISFIFSNGSYRQFYLKPNPQQGMYYLELHQTIPLIANNALDFISKKRRVELPDHFQVDWNPCLTEVNERCFVYVSKTQSEWLLHFVQSEYLNELYSLSLSKAPSRLFFTKSSLFIMQETAVFASSISLSSLSLGEILKNKKGTLAAPSTQYTFSYQVMKSDDLLKDLPTGILNETDWKKRVRTDNHWEKEEEEVLQCSDTQFEQVAKSFIEKRLKENGGIISLSNQFINAFVNRCILPDCELLSPIIQLLLASGMDISVNSTILDEILKCNDLETLFFYIKYIPVIGEKDILRIIEYCLSLEDDRIQLFATQNEWEDGSKKNMRKRFLLMIGPQLMRLRCNFTALKKIMETASLNFIYSLGLFLTTLLIHIDSPTKEEVSFFTKHSFRQGRVYISSLLEWMNCLFDSNLMRITLDMKTNTRFSILLQSLTSILDSDTQLYKELLPLKGVIHHLEHKLPLPASTTPVYTVERMEF